MQRGKNELLFYFFIVPDYRGRGVVMRGACRCDRGVSGAFSDIFAIRLNSIVITLDRYIANDLRFGHNLTFASIFVLYLALTTVPYGCWRW